MAVTYVGTETSYLTIVKTDSAALAGDQTLTYAARNESIALSSTTTPAVTKASQFTVTLSSGTATLDLTAIPGFDPEETVDGTGLKVQQIKIQNPDTNANKITVSNGAANPYRLDGATTAWSITLMPGQSVLLNLDDQSDDVGSSNKNIDLAGTGSQVCYFVLTLG